MKDTDKIKIIKNWLGTGSVNIFGRPFAGKDTQGRILAEKLNGVLLGGGEILRGSIIPDAVKRIMHEGKLVPSKDYANIVLPYLSHDNFKEKPLILSSVGRWKGEEVGVIAATQQSGHELKAVLYIDLDEDTVRQRWNVAHQISDRGERSDDTEGLLETRLDEFKQKTEPVIDMYRSMNLVVDVDGSLEHNNVHLLIIDALHKLAAKI
jgi:adenylate kinase